MLIQSLHDWPLFNTALRFPFKLSINMSIESLTRIPVAQIVRDLKPKESNWPGMIVEITEDQAIKDIHAVHEIATQLKLYGISIAIDDFGVGLFASGAAEGTALCRAQNRSKPGQELRRGRPDRLAMPDGDRSRA